jgi:hypothetical protein
MPALNAASRPIRREETEISDLIQYRSHFVPESRWKGRLITAGIVVATIAALALAAGLIFLGAVSANPLFLGIGIALGACVLIGSISALAIHQNFPTQGLRQIRPVHEQAINDQVRQPLEVLDDQVEGILP